MNFSSALFIFFFYYSLLTIGLSKGYDGIWNPFFSAWIANIGLFALGSYIMALKTDDFTLFNFIKKPIYEFYNRYIYEHPLYIFLEKKIIKMKEKLQKIVVKMQSSNKNKI